MNAQREPFLLGTTIPKWNFSCPFVTPKWGRSHAPGANALYLCSNQMISSFSSLSVSLFLPKDILLVWREIHFHVILWTGHTLWVRQYYIRLHPLEPSMMWYHESPTCLYAHHVYILLLLNQKGKIILFATFLGKKRLGNKVLIFSKKLWVVRLYFFIWYL